MTILGKLLFGGLVALLVVALVVIGVTLWWAKTTVATANTTLWVERGNVKALKAYAETVKVALDKKTQEAESLRAECERLNAQQTQRQQVLATGQRRMRTTYSRWPGAPRLSRRERFLQLPPPEASNRTGPGAK
jgi:hypothetical protein